MSDCGRGRGRRRRLTATTRMRRQKLTTYAGLMTPSSHLPASVALQEPAAAAARPSR